MTLPAAGPEVSQFVADTLEDRGIELRTEQSVQSIDSETNRVVYRRWEASICAALLCPRLSHRKSSPTAS